MLRRLDMLIKKPHSFVVYMQKSIFPVVIQPLGQPSSSFHNLSKSVFSHSNKSVPFTFAQYKQEKEQIREEEEAKNENLSREEPQEKLEKQSTEKQVKAKEEENKKNNMFLYLRPDGTIIEGKDATQSNDVPFAIVSQPIGDRKIVGAQNKWQYLIQKIIKFIIAVSIPNIFFICFVLSRSENKEKDIEELKKLKRYF